MHTLPAAKISPGADTDNFVKQQHGGLCDNNNVSSHDADRENLMMMKMMNAPHEPIPLVDEAGWSHPIEQSSTLLDTEYGASIISDSGSNSGCSSECSDEIFQEQACVNDSPLEETDLGEFLMDTFEDVYVMDVMDDLPQLDS